MKSFFTRNAFSLQERNKPNMRKGGSNEEENYDYWIHKSTEKRMASQSHMFNKLIFQMPNEKRKEKDERNAK